MLNLSVIECTLPKEIRYYRDDDTLLAVDKQDWNINIFNWMFN